MVSRPEPAAAAKKRRPAQATTTSPTQLRAEVAAKRYAIGLSTFWRLTRREDFPRRLKITPRITAWKIAELDAWFDAQQEGAKGTRHG
jgi:predicted DNA-binding transcriptional regulator AlpA